MSKFNVGDEVRDIKTGTEGIICAINSNLYSIKSGNVTIAFFTENELELIRPATLTLTEVKQ